MISIDNLKHFIAVVENKGVNRAADKIAISASSITRSIKWIEGQMGKRVFDRVGRNVILNSAGRQLYSRTKSLILDFEALTQAAGAERLLTGHYQIGASHFLCRTLVAKRMAAVVRAQPHASFDVFSLDTSVLVRKLHRGDLDLGLGFSPRFPTTLGVKTLSKGTLYLCVGKGHELAGLPFTRLRRRLNETPAIMHRATGSVERCDNHPMYRAHGIKPRIHLYWDNDDVAVELLSSGNYWTMLPDIVIDAHPQLRRLDCPRTWTAPYEVCLLWNKQRTSNELEGLFAVDPRASDKSVTSSRRR